MNLIKCEPGRNLVPLSAGLSRVFDDFFPGFFGSWEMPNVSVRPSVDVIEEEDRILLKADMPGMEKSDIKVTVHDGLLSIEGSRSESREEKGKGFARSERLMGTFSRSFNLPTWADGSKVVADYKNGVLTVAIPKVETARPREVEIKVA